MAVEREALGPTL